MDSGACLWRLANSGSCCNLAMLSAIRDSQKAKIWAYQTGSTTIRWASWFDTTVMASKCSISINEKQWSLAGCGYDVELVSTLKGIEQPNQLKHCSFQVWHGPNWDICEMSKMIASNLFRLSSRHCCQGKKNPAEQRSCHAASKLHGVGHWNQDRVFLTY